MTERAGYPDPVFVAGKRYWLSLLKLHPFLPSWTVIASPGHWEGPFHWKSRRLSIRDLAAIQTFPDDYQFYGSVYSQHKQIGNAVPPEGVRLVAKRLLPLFTGEYEPVDLIPEYEKMKKMTVKVRFVYVPSQMN